MSFADVISNGHEENNNEKPEEAWVRIQANTFTNWVNDKLRVLDVEVASLRHDLRDGVRLCRLMEVLKGCSIGRVRMKKNLNHYEGSANLVMALEAMKADGVRLVNIGAEDIAGGNLKLILGMVWTLIRRYQIGSQTKIPPKKLMLAWINAVLHPHLHVSNFAADWNDGQALHGLLEYCQPGTYPEWHSERGSSSVEHCAEAMEKADELYGIPMVVSPQNMASRDLDELSGMTYLSYFMAVNAPGYEATLKWAKQQITPTKVDNFDTDWNNGYVLSALVHALGGDVRGWPDVDTSNWELGLQKAMDVSESQLGVKSIITARDMASETVDHIAVMAYVAWHRNIEEPEPEPEPEPIPVVVTTPPSPPPELPKAEVVIVHACHVHKPTTISVNTGGLGELLASAQGPVGESVELQPTEADDGIYNIVFQPTSIGLWLVNVSVDGSPVEGSPFPVHGFDAALAVLLRDAHGAFKSEPYNFQVDASNTGSNDVTAYVLHDGQSVESHVTDAGQGRKNVTFTPDSAGVYTVAVYCGGTEVPGSPFDVSAGQRSNISGVFATGQGLRWALRGKKTNFDVDFSSQGPGGRLGVDVAGPSGQEVPALLENRAQGKFKVHYTPAETGVHNISVQYDDLPIPDSPYQVTVRKGRIYVRDLNNVAFVGHHSQFQLDASEVGVGTIEIDSDLPIRKTDKVGERVYLITFVPRKAGVHDLKIKYGAEEVEGSPFEVDVRREEEMY